MMKCSNCGNEVEKEEKFCGNCGNQINTSFNTTANENVTTKKSLVKVIKSHKILMSVFIILVCILIIYIFNNLSSEYTNISYNTSSIKNKSYYDFIDTDYYTFDFTEEELIHNIMKGNNYYQMGYKKSASTKDSNTMLYTCLSGLDVEIISITTDTRNLKVKSFKLSLVAYNTLTEEKVKELLGAYLVIASSSLLDLPGDYDSEQVTRLSNDLIENNEEKGVNFTVSYDTKTVEATFTAMK